MGPNRRAGYGACSRRSSLKCSTKCSTSTPAEIREECETKGRERFTVTTYVNRRGRVVSAGAVAEPASALEKLECVLEGVKALRMPKQKREGKVTFVLK